MVTKNNMNIGSNCSIKKKYKAACFIFLEEHKQYLDSIRLDNVFTLFVFMKYMQYLDRRQP